MHRLDFCSSCLWLVITVTKLTTLGMFERTLKNTGWADFKVWSLAFNLHLTSPFSFLNMTEYLPFLPPCGQTTRPQRELKDDQQEKYDQVLAHFSDEKFEVASEKKGPLTEEEKFWLVSP